MEADSQNQRLSRAGKLLDVIESAVLIKLVCTYIREPQSLIKKFSIWGVLL